MDRLTVPGIQPFTDGRETHIAYGDYPVGLHVIIEAALTFDWSMRMHLLSVNKMAYIWGMQIGLSPDDHSKLIQAALLHDVGKILVPKPILTKPEKLTEREYAIMKQHVELGERLVLSERANASDIEHVALLVAQHHEWFNGEGYPNGLAGEQIDPLARALAVIDAFSAMTDERPYTKARTHEEALQELERWAGKQFDPHYVESFVRMKRGRTPNIALEQRTNGKVH